ncbi:hypothetical protein SDC9_100637 [bioreactor metagenome]|uniref:Stage II sporulation protein R n=1 Tax=bioreactor metagenome TaxID=1076179 RepID=A0A645ALF4_9ZZZZ
MLNSNVQDLRAKTLRRWELALMLGIGLALVLGMWLHGQQRELAQRVVRLHVIANSDTGEDQELKLRVRDRVLEEAALLLPGGTDRQAAISALEGHLDLLTDAAAREIEAAGYDYPVAVRVEETWFPTKEYEDFSLPAGSYTALRVIIGEGEGRNWWCVVFPPLCMGAVTETAAETASDSGFTDEQVSLITGESGGYVVKFKAMELWEEFCRAAS